MKVAMTFLKLEEVGTLLRCGHQHVRSADVAGFRGEAKEPMNTGCNETFLHFAHSFLKYFGAQIGIDHRLPNNEVWLRRPAHGEDRVSCEGRAPLQSNEPLTRLWIGNINV